MVGVAVALTIGSGVLIWWMLSPSRMSAEELLRAARESYSAGQFDRAEKLAAQAFESDSHLTAAAFVASDSAAKQQAWTRAVEHLQRIASAAALVRQAEIHSRHLFQIAAAERDYRAAVALDVDHVEANQGLVNLLSLCGRMREATPFILRMIRQGGDPEVLLHLVRGERAIDNEKLLRAARVAEPQDPNPLIGLAWKALNDDQPDAAEPLLKQAIELDPEGVTQWLLLGRLLLRAQRSAEYAGWNERLPPAANEVAETWALRGQMAEALGDNDGTIRCYWESVRRGPESRAITFRLVHCLAAAGQTTPADAFRDRLQHLVALEEMQNRVLFTTDRGRPELLLPLAQAYETAGRLWEAYGWCRLAMELDPAAPAVRAYENQLSRRLKEEPVQQVTPAANVALSVDLSSYPLPKFSRTTPVSTEQSVQLIAAPTFRDDAPAAGLTFSYFDGVNGPPTHRMFEFTGGGIAVLDYDIDGRPDLMLTQGRVWPPGSPDPAHRDRLFHNGDGTQYADVTENAGLIEDGFGQGVAVCDFNADGFPDLYVGNIGRNQLWMNCGDGTFMDTTVLAGMKSEAWTTSVLMADVTGDGLPDIYDVNYLTAEDVFDRVCQNPDGSPRQCLPQDFYGQPDLLWVNDGDGHFHEATQAVLGDFAPGMGLGIAAWDADGSGRLSLFVANDTTPAFFFRPETAANHPMPMRESGIEAGVAFNGSGKATACMGIAVGDIDDDGRMDLLITNFLAEPNTLFVNSAPGFFEDQTRQRGLEEPSLPMLGFGTQFLDANLDGRLELFVANGHLDDLTRFNRPYQMPPQLFAQRDDGRFVELTAAKIGPYFEQKWLGRAAARLDWNGDGREDLTVGDLFAPVALLTNTTAETGKFLSLQLIGTASNRDAIGTTVEATIGTRKITRQLTAGDGYQCSNERRLTFGTGDVAQIDELRVRWPSGIVQTFPAIVVPSRLILREGQTPLRSAVP